MKRVVSILFLVLFTSVYAQVSSKIDLVIGDKHILRSQILKEDRVLNVYLPDDYNDTTAYNVVYLLDGSMDEDFMHIAGLSQFLRMMYMMPSTIVVGISNVDRQRDFTFEANLEEFHTAVPNGGHSELFIDFVEKELIPFIDQKYNTTQERFLIGQSLGGLVATEILIYKPSLFTHYFIVSPSLWWDKERLLQEGEKQLKDNANQLDLDVQIFVGKQEPYIMRRDARRLKRLLKRRSDYKVRFKMMRKEDHATILHNSIFRAFKNLYAPRY